MEQPRTAQTTPAKLRTDVSATSLLNATVWRSAFLSAFNFAIGALRRSCSAGQGLEGGEFFVIATVSM
jgi:hypothetical protein